MSIRFSDISSSGYGKFHVAPREERTFNGIVFDSKAEMRRYKELCLLQKAGEIKELACQPKYLLLEGFTRGSQKYEPIYYYGDFIYYDVKKKRKVVEDVKGVETDVFKIKHKLMAFRHNIELKIVKIAEIR